MSMKKKSRDLVSTDKQSLGRTSYDVNSTKGGKEEKYLLMADLEPVYWSHFVK